MKKFVLLMLFVALFAAAAGFGLSETELISQFLLKAQQYFSNSAEENAIVVSGNVEVTEVNVGFTLAGRIQAMWAEEGEQVWQGMSLAQLENAELESLVEQNRAMLSEVEMRLADLKTGARSQEIEAARANVTAIEAELSKAKKDFDRADALHKESLIPVSQLDAAKSAYNAAKARHKQGLEQLSRVKAGPTQDAVKASEFRVKQAEAALRASEERLKNTLITAPISGVILEKNAEIGEIIAQGTPVYTIGDLANPWIKVYIKEDKLGLVSLGQKAEVGIDSFPNKVYQGKVTHIASEAEFTPKNVQTQEERVKLVFEVKNSVENRNSELKPGMPADVKILLHEQTQ
jgi:HlyD family secretion protein